MRHRLVDGKIELIITKKLSCPSPVLNGLLDYKMIKLQILLHQPWRTPEGIEAVRNLLKSMGIEPTISGRTTLSAEVAEDSFERIFRAPVTKVAGRPPADQDFGRSGGAVSDDLTVPEPLREYVESIAVASPYHRL